MNSIDPRWEERLGELWADFNKYAPDACVGLVERLVVELQESEPTGRFELACAQDSTGHAELAVPLYRIALAGGLSGTRRRRATIQLASSLRNLGNATEAVELLQPEVASSFDGLDGAVRAFLALELADLGREREAVARSRTALDLFAQVLPLDCRLCQGAATE